jgi:hypothetical protein
MDVGPAHVQRSTLWSTKKQTHNINEADIDIAKYIREGEQKDPLVKKPIPINKQAL